MSVFIVIIVNKCLNKSFVGGSLGVLPLKDVGLLGKQAYLTFFNFVQ